MQESPRRAKPEEKDLIRDELEQAVARKATLAEIDRVRRDLATRLGLTYPQVKAIGAWKRGYNGNGLVLKPTEVIAEDTTTAQSTETDEGSPNMSIMRPKIEAEQSSVEQDQVSEPHNPSQIPATVFIADEIDEEDEGSEDNLEFLIELPTSGEFIEYDNDTKNLWREMWADFLVERMSPQEIAEARVLCFPGIDGHEADMYLRRGFKPHNLICVEGGKKDARQKFELEMSKRGITPRLGRLQKVVAQEAPFDVISLDLLGSFSREIVRSIRHIKLRRNKKVYALVNWMEGRESKLNQETLKYALLKRRQMLAGVVKPSEQGFDYDSVDLREARQWVGFHLMRKMGQDWTENWLYPELSLNLPIDSETREGVRDQTPEMQRVSEAYITLRYGLDMLGDSIARCLSQYSSVQAEQWRVGIHNCADSAILGQPILKNVKHYTYKSESQGGRKFQSDFGELFIPSDLYQQSRHTMKFLLQVLHDVLAHKEFSGTVAFTDKHSCPINISRAVIPSDVMYYGDSMSGFTASIACRKIINDLEALSKALIGTADYELSTDQRKISRTLIKTGG